MLSVRRASGGRAFPMIGGRRDMTGADEAWVGRAIGGGRYEILERLGDGGMGDVFLARDHRLEADVVVKIPRRAYRSDADFLARFRREIRSLVRLTHSSVVPILDFGEEDGAPFAVLKYLSGGSLKDRLAGRQSADIGSRDGRQAVSWLPSIAAALDYLHQHGYVHRDVKPANILFDAQENAFLADFGIIKALADSADAAKRTRAATGTGMVLGTPEYMAPEVILGEPFDGRADQYSLAVTVFEQVCGRCPFEDAVPTAVLVAHTTRPIPDPGSLCPDLPGSSAKALRRALAKSPDERFGSCAEFAEAFTLPARDTGRRTRTMVEKPPPRATKPAAARGPAPKRSDRSAAWALGGIGLACLLLASVYFIRRSGAGRPVDAPPPQIAPRHEEAPKPPGRPDSFPEAFPLEITAATWGAALERWEELAQDLEEQANLARLKSRDLSILADPSLIAASDVVEQYDEVLQRTQATLLDRYRSLESWLRSFDIVYRDLASGVSYAGNRDERRREIIRQRARLSTIQVAIQALGDPRNVAAIRQKLSSVRAFVDADELKKAASDDLDFAQVLHRSEIDSLRRLGLFALARAGREAEVQGASRLLQTGALATAERIRCCKALLGSMKPDAARSVADDVRRDPSRIQQIPAALLEASMNNHPEAWRGTLENLAVHGAPSIAATAFLAILRTKQPVDAERLVSSLQTGPLSESSELILTASINDRFEPLYRFLPSILDKHPDLRLDAVETADLDALRGANPDAAAAAAFHLLRNGVEEQAAWALDLILSRQPPLPEPILKGALAGNVRVGHGYLLTELLKRKDRSALVLAGWLLDRANAPDLDPADVDVRAISPAAAAMEGLGSLLAARMLEGGQTQKSWALQRLLGAEGIQRIVAAERTVAEVSATSEVLLAAWQAPRKQDGTVSLKFTKIRDAIQRLREMMESDALTKWESLRRDIVSEVDRRKSDKTGPFGPGGGAALFLERAQLQVRFIEIGLALGEKAQFLKAAEERGVESILVTSDDMKSAKLVKDEVARLDAALAKNLDQIRPLAACIPSFPFSDAKDQARVQSAEERAALGKSVCRKCQGTGKRRCDCDESRTRRCTNGRCVRGSVRRETVIGTQQLPNGVTAPILGAVWEPCPRCHGATRIRCEFCDAERNRSCPACKGEGRR